MGEAPSQGFPLHSVQISVEIAIVTVETVRTRGCVGKAPTSP
jgi:hypothetical protein